ncbi:hypothetical protein NTGBS_450007 [Candidatus Nitrotoga sp. BS]|uniref:tyrosine-type recombinase/integrase n=1 Tax=Candidatus Nitrotoga sp. BS TaxID=2890408 RepID=UPI001EF3812D|nr:tyrosine-type recombinase/integrase [Candidatus Nitrotoga sp. BS]CAH1201953.1 hypothetical protein NTGBS_450007 [Candidatus Nitrotoga sp. BS]
MLRRAAIHPDQAKATKAIHVPLNSVAMAVLLQQVGKHTTKVFTRSRETQLLGKHTCMAGALKRVDIGEFRWHDLRHTWASWLAQQGTPLNVLKGLSGWESDVMVNRYAHLSKPQLMELSELVSNVLDSTILAQSKNKKASKIR